MTTTYTAYKTHNSPFLVLITDFDGSAYTAAQMALITQIQLKYIYASGATAEVADSLAVGHEDVFDLETYATVGKVKIDIGLLDFTAGRDVEAELIVYDPDYPEGRVLNELMDVLVSEDADDGSVLTPALLTAPLTQTGDYDIVLADFNRASIRLNATVLKTFTLPVGTADLDGKRIKFIIENIGDLAIVTQGDDTIINETDTTLTGTQRYSSVTLEYDWAIKAYTISTSTGKWGSS